MGTWRFYMKKREKKCIIMHRNLDFIRLMFYRDHHMNRSNLQLLKTNNTGDTDWRKRFDDDGFRDDGCS